MFTNFAGHPGSPAVADSVQFFVSFVVMETDRTEVEGLQEGEILLMADTTSGISVCFDMFSPFLSISDLVVHLQRSM